MSQIPPEVIQKIVVQREKIALGNIRSAVEHLSSIMNVPIEVLDKSIRESVAMSEPAWLSRVTDLLNTIESEIG